VVEIRSQSCHTCQADLRAENGHLVKVNQITERYVSMI
jgi:hypothetical protein